MSHGVILFEYCQLAHNFDWLRYHAADYLAAFDSTKLAIESAFPGTSVRGNSCPPYGVAPFRETPGGDPVPGVYKQLRDNRVVRYPRVGSFEIELQDGRLIHSKLESDVLPKPEAVVKTLQSLLAQRTNGTGGTGAGRRGSCGHWQGAMNGKRCVVLSMDGGADVCAHDQLRAAVALATKGDGAALG